MVFSVFYSCPDNDKISYHPNQEITVRSSLRRGVRERERKRKTRELEAGRVKTEKMKQYEADHCG